MRFSGPACALGLLLVGLLFYCGAGAGWWRNDAALALLLGVVAVGGWSSGRLAAWSDAGRCAARLPAGEVRLLGRVVEPTGLDEGRVALEVPACGRGLLLARWPRAEALREGTPVRVDGRWLPRDGARRPDGTLLVSRVEVVGDPAPTWSERIRGAVMRASHRLYGARAPLVDALILGRRGGLDRGLTDAFAASGLVHLLSISGFHVGVVVAWLVLLLRGCGLPQTRALVVASAVATLYVAWLGWEAPAARAALLAWLLAHARVRQRPTTDATSLALTCLVVTGLDPWAILDLGGWLSASALWGAVRFTKWGDTVTGEGFLSRTTWSSVGATLGTAPITAAALGTVAPIGIVLNFPAIPLGALAVPGVAASLLFAWVPGLAEALAAGSGLVLWALEWLAQVGAAMPGGAVMLEPGWRTGVIAALVLALACWITAARTPGREAVRRAALLAACASWASVAAVGRPAASNGPLRLFFLAVGQGDAAAIRTPQGRWVLVDAGPRDAKLDAGASVVAPFLRRHGARALDLLVVSHAHADHVGGAASVMARMPVSQVLEPAELSADAGYGQFLEAVAASGSRYGAAKDGQRVVIDGVQFTVLHPDRRWPEWGLDLNEDSVVLLVEYGAFRAIFSGDAGFVAEERLRGRVQDISLLKVGHHGSRTATSEAWLQELRPEVAIISVGRRNRYGHPTADALDRLRTAGARIRRTDDEGTVTVETDGTTMTISGRSGVEHLPLPPPSVTP